MSTIVIQCHAMLASTIAQLSNYSQAALCTRQIVNKIICSPINSQYRINLSLDTPHNYPLSLNILHPAVLITNFGANLPSNDALKNEVK